MDPLLGLFGASFIAATLLPLPSEAALFAYLKAYPERASLAIAVATIGNTAGGMTTYLIGRLVPNRKLSSKAIDILRRWGAPATFFTWLPVIGEALAAGAGWLRVNWIYALLCMAAGRLSRYIVVAALA